MKKLLKNLAMIVLSVCVSIPAVFSQGRPYRGPDDPAGDIAAIRAGYMNGNRILLYFQNTTELSHWPEVNMSKWPNNYKGVRMLDGVALLVGARVFIRKTDAAVDTIPVTDPVKIRFYGAQKQLDTLYYLQTQYREEMDTDPTGTLKWGFYPPFGYFNETSEYPAMSNLPESWPPQGWPAQGHTLKWPGEWDGRFGRGVIYADLETYFDGAEGPFGGFIDGISKWIFQFFQDGNGEENLLDLATKLRDALDLNSTVWLMPTANSPQPDPATG